MMTTTDNTERSEVTDNAPVKVQDFRNFIVDTIEKEIGTEVYEEQTDAEPQGDCWLADASLKTAIAAFEKVAAHAFAEGRKQGLKEMDEARNYLQHEMAEKGPLSKYGQRTAQNTVDTLRQEYSATK